MATTIMSGLAPPASGDMFVTAKVSCAGTPVVGLKVA